MVKISVKPDSLKYADEVVASVNYKHRNTNKKRFMHVNFDSELRGALDKALCYK